MEPTMSATPTAPTSILTAPSMLVDLPTSTETVLREHGERLARLETDVSWIRARLEQTPAIVLGSAIGAMVSSRGGRLLSILLTAAAAWGLSRLGVPASLVTQIEQLSSGASAVEIQTSPEPGVK